MARVYVAQEKVVLEEFLSILHKIIDTAHRRAHPQQQQQQQLQPLPGGGGGSTGQKAAAASTAHPLAGATAGQQQPSLPLQHAMPLAAPFFGSALAAQQVRHVPRAPGLVMRRPLAPVRMPPCTQL